jgi:hypothetical protein
MEGFLICANDTIFFGSINQKYTAMVLTVLAWLFSLIYATDAGLIFLDTIDYYINFVMLLVGGFKCFAAGWLYNIDEQIDSCGAQLVFTYMVASFGPVFLACIVWFSVADAQTALWAGFVGLIVFYLVGLSFTAYLIHKKMKNNVGFWSWKSTIYDLPLRNVTDLCTDFSGVLATFRMYGAYSSSTSALTLSSCCSALAAVPRQKRGRLNLVITVVTCSFLSSY